jgi:hypothetical protein
MVRITDEKMKNESRSSESGNEMGHRPSSMRQTAPNYPENEGERSAKHLKQPHRPSTINHQTSTLS